MTDLRHQLQASLGDVYAIERELGGAGMSRVFVAEEKSLGRRVVVKVLPADLAGGVSMARFRREISMAAQLQHPHIVPLLTASEVEGQPYYTMPFVDGESLRARLSHGELPIAETVAILRDVAQALAYAHGKGVAHRDIKPDNVLLAGTSAMITDFGVAKALHDAAVSGPLTSIGVALGTPAYMAPEQAAADPSTDLRADLYAFGAMAYEMLAGHQLFAGRNAQGMLAAHATEAPSSIAALRPAAPAPLAGLVMRCLEKRPGDRPQTAAEIVRALDAIAATDGGSAPAVASFAAPATRAASRPRARLVALGAAVLVAGLLAVAWWRMRAAGQADGAIRTLAVLPFENTSGDTTFNYLEDGITDQVREALNAIPMLTVKARSSSRQLKGRSAHEVGAKLGVGAVLQGTVSRSNSRLHVTAELVRAADEVALWSSTFDGEAGELAGMQDKIARAIAGKLQVAGGDANPAGRGADGARGTANIEAYDSFLQGRHAFDQLEFPRAITFFRQAVARDPRFARAHAYLAMSYANAPTLGFASPDSMNALARGSARTALALDSTVAGAYAAEAFALINEMRFDKAVDALAKAASLDSTNVDMLYNYGAALAQVGRLDEGLVLARRARERDPLSGTALGILSAILAMTRQYDAAIAEVRAGLVLDPRNVLMHQGLGFDYAFAGKPDSAVAAFEAAFRLDSTLFGGRSNLVFGYAVAGRWNDAARERRILEKEPGGNSPNTARMVAAIAFGEHDAAMTFLEHGVAAHEPLLGIGSISCDQLFDPLKANPRFAALMRRLGARACPASGKWPIAARTR